MAKPKKQAEQKPLVKKKYIETPEILWELFLEYVLFERSNPMFRVDYVGKDGRVENTPLETPITFEGFECYLADKKVINDLGDYASNKGGAYEAYSTIITRIQKNCFVHNFKGASVGLFNPNIIAKKLGLVEKTQTSVIKEQMLFPDVE
jgi:hypothetical protein